MPGRAAGSFLGITRNFSCSGLSFESQCFDLVPGDSLEFRFKHPEYNLTAASRGEVVWKRDATRFECLTGIKFREADSPSTYEMMNVMSAYGNVSAGSFLDEADTVYEVKNRLKREWIPELISPENAVNTPVVIPENKDNQVPALAEEPDKGRESNDDTMERGRRKGMKSIYLPLIIGAALLLVFALPEYYDNFTHSNKDVVTVNEQSAKIEVPASEAQPMLGEETGNSNEITGDQTEPEETMGEEQGSEGEGEEMNITHADSPPSSMAVSSGKEYYVQVGSWKNPEYALEALDKLKADYPDAYMTIAGDFHKVKIPHITSVTEGSRIIKYIKENLHFNALLVLHTSENP